MFNEGEHAEQNHRLQRWINDLQSGMFINCVYCGHSYGPNTEQVPAAALRDHIANCEHHPLAQALRERDEWKARAERAERYAGVQCLRSDFQTADHMRDALDGARVEIEKWYIQAVELKRDIERLTATNAELATRAERLEKALNDKTVLEQVSSGDRPLLSGPANE